MNKKHEFSEAVLGLLALPFVFVWAVARLFYLVARGCVGAARTHGAIVRQEQQRNRLSAERKDRIRNPQKYLAN